MPKITISNQGHKVVNFNLNNEQPKPVLAILQENYIDWMHACGGNGRCTTCRCKIVEGMENLTERTEPEKMFLNAQRIKPIERMACQAIPKGDVVLEVPEKCKLPGVMYTN
ncbi:MAG: (2Fe-2S)-binding protein [Cyclobacteriaceae bacterium]|nr:(2Fe-2S)-binding protein [Cyclobacteriaceae bacterium]